MHSGCLCSAEKYLREVWPAITRALKEHGIACELNLVRLSTSAVCDNHWGSIMSARPLYDSYPRRLPCDVPPQNRCDVNHLIHCCHVNIILHATLFSACTGGGLHDGAYDAQDV